MTPPQILLILVLVSAVVRHSAAGAETIDVGKQRQLFIDDLFFEEVRGISLRVHTPRKTGDRTTAQDRPWERGGPIPPKRIAIGRAVWRRHGFVSLDAGPESGRLMTRPLVVHGGRLVLNADASRGELKVALLEPSGQPLPHFQLEDCEPLRRDATQHRLRWRSGQAMIEMKSARLSSLESVAQ